MESAPPEDVLVFKRDLENIRTPDEFVDRILEDIDKYLAVSNRGREWFNKIRAAIAGAEVAGVKAPEVKAVHWKTHLERIIHDLLRNDERTIVFLWDEVPLMLDNIRHQCGEQEAMDVLDTLRKMRLDHPRLRMVFTGSVGLHHVLGALQRAGHGNRPTNDMLFRDLPGLYPEDARGLVWSLMRGEGIEADSIESAIHLIAETVNCLPYYIHHVVGRLKDDRSLVTTQMIEQAIVALLLDPQDPCGFRDFQARIVRYYMEADRPIALTVLDVLSTAQSSLSFVDLFNLVSSRMVIKDDEALRNQLVLLESDHYVIRASDGGYAFRFSIIARAWRIQRGLL
jgi:hypothetical protein